MVQAPLPTGMPASVASYCASSLPWAKAGVRRRTARSAKARTGRPPPAAPLMARRGEIMLEVVTWGRSSTTRVQVVI